MAGDAGQTAATAFPIRLFYKTVSTTRQNRRYLA
jgi:hypothetical protein